MSDDHALSYLQGDSTGAKRDLIARCYYEVAQGDPKSGPVAYAVLLSACAEQFAKTPKELADATVRFDWALTAGREFERKFTDRVEKTNAVIVAAFKDEAARTQANLQTTNELNRVIVQKARDTLLAAQDINIKGQSLVNELNLIRLELKDHRDDSEKTAQAAKTMAENQIVTKELVIDLTGTAAVHWMTIGIGTGSALTVVALHTVAGDDILQC